MPVWGTGVTLRDTGLTTEILAEEGSAVPGPDRRWQGTVLHGRVIRWHHFRPNCAEQLRR